MSGLRFPDGFLWGASTSAYQIEGGPVDSDWTAWELAGNAPAVGTAADSWNRWREDLAIVSELGLNIYRISIEWARVEPEPGHFDEDAFRRYRRILVEARARGVKTMVTLWHFTNPRWFAESGGWDSREAPSLFGEYARVTAERLGDVVDFWATINEADTYIAQGYIRGVWPPGRKYAWGRGWRAYMRLAEAHRTADESIKRVCGPGASVGLTHGFTWARPEGGGGVLLALVTRAWNYVANDAFVNATYPNLDWLGVQYYLTIPLRVFGAGSHGHAVPTTDMGWPIVPRGLYEVVMRTWRRYRVPILVTENGLADATDSQRARFVLDHLAWLHRAVERGADVRGYLHWSLVDNYEWSFGYGMRFGLTEVDFETHERSIRPSARVYADVVSANALPQPLRPEFEYSNGAGSLAPKV